MDQREVAGHGAQIVHGQDALTQALGRDEARRARPPWRADSGEKPSHEVEVVAVLNVRVPTDLAVELVQDIAGIDLYEVKVDSVHVRPLTLERGEYYLRGRFAALVPWEGWFTYQLHERGFHSTANEVVTYGLDVSGGFCVKDHPNGARIVHYEHYLLPPALRWAHHAHRSYIRRSIRTEMADVDRFLRLLQRRATHDAGALARQRAGASAVTSAS